LIRIDWQCLDNKVDGRDGSGHAVPKLSTVVYLVLILSYTYNHLVVSTVLLCHDSRHQHSLVAKTEFCMKTSVVHATTGDL
jgi:hypothetical protein